MAVVDVVLTFIKAVVFVYDVVTYPVYTAIQMPWLEKQKQKLGPIKGIKNDTKEISFFREKGNSEIYREIIVNNKIDTVTKAFEYSVKKFGSRQCLGTRQILGICDEVQKNGKMFQKLSLGDYRWMNYDQVKERAYAFGRGLRKLGIQPGSAISMYAETRAEWMMSCLGAFGQNIHVCTVYTNLGDEAVIHALNETETSVVVISYELLPKFETILPSCPHIEAIIFMEDQISLTKTQGFKAGVKILPFSKVCTDGESMGDMPSTPPSPDDTAIVMYTSGSTGTPKGVVLTHSNLIATMQCLMFMITPKEDDLYIAYLPLAHVLELLSENTMMLFGVKIGYSSPNTMTDMSTKVQKGSKGDASILKPSMMCAVPLIMDRIYKNIMDSVNKRGPAFKKVFEYCYAYKNYWMKRGRATPVCDKIVFNKIKALLGGRTELILVGGAPLSPETHEFIRTCLGVTVIQGYSLTETTCTGTVMENDDPSVGTVGRPMTGLEVKLVDWEEGSYKVSDKPQPRGEILIGGATIAKEYYKMPEKTQESFFVDPQTGKRWFRTGDIGEMTENGQLKIVDRKKDLVKLQLGEYVSLGKVESVLKTNHLVENICVYGDPYKNSTVALVVPSKAHLEELAIRLDKTTASYENICSDPEVIEAVRLNLAQKGMASGLEKFELPAKISLCSEQWTPESGLITAAFKLKRKVLQVFYQSTINNMYQQVTC